MEPWRPILASILTTTCILCSQLAPGISGDRVYRYGTLPTSLEVGRSINLLHKYGFLTRSIKVFPGNGYHDWLFKENSGNMFQKSSITYYKKQPNTNYPKYDRHFYVNFCKSTSDLLDAYFDHFKISGIPKAQKAFTSSLSLKTLAHYFGVNPFYFSDSYSFVLVRLFRRDYKEVLKGTQKVLKSIKRRMKSVRLGSHVSSIKFFDIYGTHVIKEYEVGDVLYQVYVFDHEVFRRVKAQFQYNVNDLDKLERYLSPVNATHVGTPKSAASISENTGFSDATLLDSYGSIFKIYRNKVLLPFLARQQGKLMFSLKLEKITEELPNGRAKERILEVLDNILALYYNTM